MYLVLYSRRWLDFYMRVLHSNKWDYNRFVKNERGLNWLYDWIISVYITKERFDDWLEDPTKIAM